MIFNLDIQTRKNGVNNLVFTPCTINEYSNYMDLYVAINNNFKGMTGNGTQNLNNSLAEFKSKGWSGIVVFEQNPRTNQLIYKNSIEILEHYLEIGKCRVEIYNGKRVFIFE